MLVRHWLLCSWWPLVHPGVFYKQQHFYKQRVGDSITGYFLFWDFKPEPLPLACILTNRCLKKIVDILPTTFSNTWTREKTFVFWLKCYLAPNTWQAIMTFIWDNMLRWFKLVWAFSWAGTPVICKTSNCSITLENAPFMTLLTTPPGKKTVSNNYLLIRLRGLES